jgi:transcriptional regulator with XRE-family HTH domain
MALGLLYLRRFWQLTEDNSPLSASMTDHAGERIGARLRSAREQSGKSLRQIADATKLTVRTLDALESEKIDRLPGGIYRRAIVRAHAREIGLNPETIVRQFLEQHPDDLPALPPVVTRKPTSYDLPPEPAVTIRPRRPWQAVLSVIGALIPIAAGIVYFAIGVRGDDASRQVEFVTGPSAADVWEPSIVPAAGFSEAPPALGRPVSVLITVSSQTDLQVVADGREVVSRRVRPGERVQLDLSHDVVLSGDNAGAVHFSINGRAGRRLGAAGAPLNVRIGREDYDAWLVQP